MHLQLLGDFCVEVGGEVVTALQSPRLQALLAYLALHRSAPQRRQHIAFLFWPDSPEAQARTNLRKVLHHLQQALPASARYLVMEGQNLGWRPDAPVGIDVADFGADAYDFTHDKLREVVYRSLSTARRRLAHRRVAQALEALHPTQRKVLASQIARHYDLAGQATEAVANWTVCGKKSRRPTGVRGRSG